MLYHLHPSRTRHTFMNKSAGAGAHHFQLLWQVCSRNQKYIWYIFLDILHIGNVSNNIQQIVNFLEIRIKYTALNVIKSSKNIGFYIGTKIAYFIYDVYYTPYHLKAFCKNRCFKTFSFICVIKEFQYHCSLSL